MSKLYEGLRNLYPVSKTLRFELKPQGKTAEWIEKKGLVKEDYKKAEDSVIIKQCIDRYHKFFIEKSLQDFKIDETLLNEYFELYTKQNKSEKEVKTMQSMETFMRKHIVERMKSFDEYKALTAATPKELLEKYLPMLASEEEKKIIESFKGFATYFTGFQENRLNMYSSEEKSTAIAYRLINQNLDKFIRNIQSFEKVKAGPMADLFRGISEELKNVLHGSDIADAFSMEYFNLTLTQRGIDEYNTLIGGIKPEDGKPQIKGLNNYINEFNQKNPHSRLPKLQPLYKQILSDRNNFSFIIDKFETDKEVLDVLTQFLLSKENDDSPAMVDVLERQKTLIGEIEKYDLRKIYVRTGSSLSGINTISQAIYGDYSKIQQYLKDDYDQGFDEKQRTRKSYEEKKKSFFNNLKAIEIDRLEAVIEKNSGEKQIITSYLKNESERLYMSIMKKIQEARPLFDGRYLSEDLIQDDVAVEKIKGVMDGLKSWQNFSSALSSSGIEDDIDNVFYGEFEQYNERLQSVTALYNKIRNYLTRKPYKTEKIKLNFENATLLHGWDLSKETDNTAILMERSGKFYLGIMDKKHNRIFRDVEESVEEDSYCKMEYKLLPGPNKMLPKVIFPKKSKGPLEPSEEILRIKEEETFKKGDNFNIADCRKLIDFYKEAIDKYEEWSVYNFKFSDTEEYNDISDFYREVEKQGYKVSFKRISAAYIDRQVEEGNLYLFQIYNKDFSEYSNGKPNLHTLYWKMLFDETNLRNPIYKLNGEAEVFYRKGSIERKVTHPANVPIDNKNPDTAKKKEKSVFAYDLIKDRRFTEDKFQFHVPITMNFINRGISKINTSVNEKIHDADEIYCIGIDRGERHLLYYSVINSKGQIVEQGSLNRIDNVDYRNLLEAREKDRDSARKNWKNINNIKELKEGYLSQTVHKLTQLMIRYNAVLVLEDLNAGFKNSRIKVEKQVYQKFEKAMIDKTNYLVDKQTAVNKEGGLLKAYQLTNEFESFSKMGKQNGIMFYVPAWMTSKIDPTTGFANMFYSNQLKYESVEKSKNFFSLFETIRYNEEDNYFELTFDYEKFNNRSAGKVHRWTVCTYGERLETFRNPEKNSQWDTRQINLTDRFKSLLEEYHIEYHDKEIKDALITGKNLDKNFYERLYALFRLILQMRNSKTGSETDFMLSSVKNKYGYFYDSRKSEVAHMLPDNADANGAYNIARKGLMVVEKIRVLDKDKIKNIKWKDLTITQEEWLSYAQEHN